MPSTYEPIATITLGSSQNSVTFSSVPNTYTDLILVATFVETTAATNTNGYITFNTDTYNSSTNYSYTRLDGNSISASSSRTTNNGSIFWAYDLTTGPTVTIFQVMNYANTNVNKTSIMRQDNAGAGTLAQVALWRNTAAINAINLYGSDQVGVPTADPFAAGSTFTLYGVKSA